MNVCYTLRLLVLFIFLFSAAGCQAIKNAANLPAYSLAIVNGMEGVEVDIEVRGEIQRQGLRLGQTYYYELALFLEGTQITLIAKGYDENDRFLGMETKVIHLYNQGQGYRRQSDVWTIQNLNPPVKLRVTDREVKK